MSRLSLCLNAVILGEVLVSSDNLFKGQKSVIALL